MRKMRNIYFVLLLKGLDTHTHSVAKIKEEQGQRTTSFFSYKIGFAKPYKFLEK